MWSCKAPGSCVVSSLVGNLGFTQVLSSLLVASRWCPLLATKKTLACIFFLSLKKHFLRPFSGAIPGLGAEEIRRGLDSAVLDTHLGEVLNKQQQSGKGLDRCGLEPSLPLSGVLALSKMLHFWSPDLHEK